MIRRLRPEMFGDRLRHVDGCGTASHIWVNGQLIRFPPRDVTPPTLPSRKELVLTGYREVTLPNGKLHRIKQYRRIPPVGEAAAGPLVRTVLASIKPEHVAEMTYSDCFDTKIAKLYTNNAVFVVLKYGFVYDLDRGSIPYRPESAPPR